MGGDGVKDRGKVEKYRGRGFRKKEDGGGGRKTEKGRERIISGENADQARILNSFAR